MYKNFKKLKKKKKNKQSNKLFAKWNGYNHSFNSQINTTVVI